jgi:predicted phosphoadenosine phosphosulfate sulfurtransferase
MLDEGIELENTHEISRLCTKPDVYEIVKIKSGFPDETKVHANFRICPSWKSVCLTIMKNDWTGTYMGCSRTKDQNLLKRNALKRFANT